MRLWLWCLTILGVAASAAPSHAEEPLNHIPATAGLVVRIAPRNDLAARVDEFLTAIGPRAGSSDAFLDELLGETLDVGGSRLHATIDPTSPTYRVVFAYTDDELRPLEPIPQAVFFRTADVDAARRAIAGVEGDGKIESNKRDDGFDEITTPRGVVYFSTRGQWAVAASNEITLAALKLQPGETATLDSLAPDAKKLLSAGELGLWLNTRKVWEVYQPALARAKENVLAQIDQMPDQAFGGPESAGPAKVLYKMLAEALFVAGGDARWVGLQVDVSADGVEVEKFASIAEDSATAQFLASHRPNAMPMLDKLPEAAAMYFALAIDYATIDTDRVLALMPNDEEYRRKFLAAWQLMRGANLGPATTAMWLPTDATTGFETVQVQEVGEPQKVIAATRGIFGESGTKFKSGGATVEGQLSPDKEQYNGRAIDVMKMKITLAVPGDQQAAAIVQPILRQFYGGETYTTRVATGDKYVLQAGGNTPRVIQNAIDVLDSGEKSIGRVAAYRKTRERLSPTANGISLIDAPRFIVGIVKMLRTSPAGPALAALPFNFARQPAASYAGFSVTIEKSGVRAKAFVPVEHPREIMAIFSPAQ